MRYILLSVAVITICVLMLRKKKRKLSNIVNKKDSVIIEEPSQTNQSIASQFPREMYIPEVNKMDHVFGNIYISNWACSIDEKLLQQNNIKYVLCINKELKKSDKDMELYQKLGITTLYIEADDHPTVPIRDIFDTAYKFIELSLTNDKPNGNVLIHCSMGISRSATIVLMYLMKKMKNSDGSSISRQQAFDLLKSKRNAVNPNPGFWKALDEVSL